MHFEQFFRVAVQTNSKIHRLRSAILRQNFSVYQLYGRVRGTKYVSPRQLLEFLQSHDLGFPSHLQIAKVFRVTHTQQVKLADFVKFLNADELFQISMYGDGPVTKKICRRLAKLIHVEVLLVDLTEKFRTYLEASGTASQLIIEAFHQIDRQRVFFVSPLNLFQFLKGTYGEKEIGRLLLKLFKVTAVPFLDFYQFFTQRKYRVKRKGQTTSERKHSGSSCYSDMKRCSSSSLKKHLVF